MIKLVEQEKLGLQHFSQNCLHLPQLIFDLFKPLLEIVLEFLTPGGVDSVIAPLPDAPVSIIQDLLAPPSALRRRQRAVQALKARRCQKLQKARQQV